MFRIATNRCRNWQK